MSSGVSSWNAQNTDDAWRVLDLVSDWLKHAEAKAGLALAAAGVLGGPLYSLVSGLSAPAWWVVVVMIVPAVFATTAGMCSAIPLLLRLLRQEPAVSKIYYDHISRAYPKRGSGDERSLSEFQEDFAEVVGVKSSLLDELCAQIWANSHVARVKFVWSTRAMACVMLSAAFIATASAGVA